MRFLLSLLSIIFYLILSISVSVAVPFQNGSFEGLAIWSQETEGMCLFSCSYYSYDYVGGTRLPGWTIENSVAEWNWNDAPNGATPSPLSQDGIYYLSFFEKPGHMGANIIKISQIFDTVSGKEYEVSYYKYAFGTPVSNDDLDWEIRDTNSSGTIIRSSTRRSSTTDTWEQDSFTFTATSTTTYLSFELAQMCVSNANYLDNITVTEVTPPSPIWSNTTASYPYDPGHARTKSVLGQDMVIDQTLLNNGGSPNADSVQIRL